MQIGPRDRSNSFSPVDLYSFEETMHYDYQELDAENYKHFPDTPDIYGPYLPVESNDSYGRFGINTQMPTPMPSHSPSPNAAVKKVDSDYDSLSVSVSTSFNPNSHAIEPDLVFSTSDSVMFYVNSAIITRASSKAFNSLVDVPLSDPKLRHTTIYIPDTSEILNVILHALYGTSCAQNSPSFQTLETAVDRMPFYDIDPKKHIVPPTPFYNLLLSYAPLSPLPMYALAGHHNLEELAINVSSHLLSFPPATISDEAAQRMGAIYLKRLLHLHHSRFDALKRILLSPPHPHPATKDCTFTDQQKITRAWALVSAHLVWDASPDLSTFTIRRALNPLVEHLTCRQCNDSLKDRIKEVVTQWASVKRTI